MGYERAQAQHNNLLQLMSIEDPTSPIMKCKRRVMAEDKGRERLNAKVGES